MSLPALEPPYDQLLATAERVARERPEVDVDMAREVFLEAATLLHDGLVLDDLDLALDLSGRKHGQPVDPIARPESDERELVADHA